MPAVATILLRVYQAVLLIGGIVWALDLLPAVGISLIETEWLAPYLGIGIAAGLLMRPYGERPGGIDILLGFAAIGCWFWLSLNYENWIIDIAGDTPDKYVPGAVGIVLLMEALRKTCGLPISILVWVLIAYAFLGYFLPPPLQADRLSPEGVIFYLYYDTNAVPGLVLVIVASIVLAFIVLGKLMEVSGATQFFTDLAMAIMGHRRGGPAKVAIVASGLFGSISSSPVGNIMSTGVVTIPLMKRIGFRAHYAAAIEAVASTGGQIAPPVMGATAFLMAEFLQISYGTVVIAAVIPAVLYYLCLFMQVDALASREGFEGLARSELPRLGSVFSSGWIFILPLGVLLYLLFWANRTPAAAALIASAVLIVLALAKGNLRSRIEWQRLIFEGGASMVPLVMIAGGAGVVVGVMNVTGLGQSLAFILVQAGSEWGLLAMLVITAILSIILGMGMPSTAIYVVLAAVIAPALVQMGMTQIAAHFFIFYFGVMSFLTPPVAVSSFVAAGLAGADMWKTGWIGMQLSIVAYLLPFLWAYDPALLMDGSWLAVGIVVATTVAGILLIARSLELAPESSIISLIHRLGLWVVAGLVATSPILLGAESYFALLLAGVGYGAYYALGAYRMRNRQNDRERHGSRASSEPAGTPR